MVRIGVVPNLHIYNVLVHACCKSGDVEKAEELLSEMELKCVFPDIFTNNTLIEWKEEE
jgi:pentatricopeptide repeat protein